MNMVSTKKNVVSDYSVDSISYKFCSTKNIVPSLELPNVRRKLFGLTEEVQTAELLQDFSEKAAKSCKDWNFDFVKECPLTGRYLWHRVRACDMPAFYSVIRRPDLNSCVRNFSSEGDTDIEDYCATSSDENEHCDAEESKKEKSNSKKPRLVQTSMKDFTRVQKRRSSNRLRMKQLGSPRIRRYLHHQDISSQI